MTKQKQLELVEIARKAYNDFFGVMPRKKDVLPLEYGGSDYFLVQIGRFDFTIADGKIYKISYESVSDHKELFKPQWL